jgi:hypothetical protein
MISQKSLEQTTGKCVAESSSLTEWGKKGIFERSAREACFLIVSLTSVGLATVFSFCFVGLSVYVGARTSVFQRRFWSGSE